MQISTRRFWIGAACGALATVAMTAVMFLVMLLGSSASALPEPLAVTSGILVRVTHSTAATAPIVVLSILVHLGYGAVWGGLLAVSTPRVTVFKGIVVALGLWAMLLIFYVPMAGGSAFVSATSPRMWLVTLLGHVIYGATLGALVEPASRRAHLPRFDAQLR